MNYYWEFVIPRKRDDLLVNQASNQFYVSEVFSVDDVTYKIDECKINLKESGCDFILENFGSLYSVLVNFKMMSFETLQYCYNEVIIEELKALNNSLCLLFGDEDVHTETRTKMLNVTKMSVYITVEFLKSFREKVDQTYNLVINKRGQKNTKLLKLREEHNWDWEENERNALDIILWIIKQPLHRLWDPPTPEEEFVKLIEDCCYSILEKPSVTSLKMKPSREILFEILAVLITQYNNAISCKVKIVQMLKHYDHLVSTLAQAVIFFVQKYNCRSLVREVILEIIETGSEMDQYSPDQSSFRVFSNFIVEIAAQEPELVLPCVNILIPNLNYDPYSMRICALTVMAEIVTNVLHSDMEEHSLTEEKRKTRDAFLEHLLDHIVDVHVFVRSKVLKLWQNIFQKNAVPKHFLVILLDLAIQRLNDKSSNVVKNAIRLIILMLQNNPFGALLNEESVKENLRALKSKIIENECSLERPCIFKLWFCLRSEFFEFMMKKLQDKEKELDDDKWREEDDFESDSEEDLEKECNENEVKNELMNSLVKIRSAVLKNDLASLFTALSSFEHTYLKRAKYFNKLSDICQYYQWLLGHICKEDENVILISAISTCTNLSELKTVINQPITVAEQLETEFGRDQAVFTYCEDYLKFVETVRTAVSLIGELMVGESTVETLEAIEFFKIAYAFSLSGVEEGLGNMILLINSKEVVIREAVVRAYKTIYLNFEIDDPYEEAAGIVDKLTKLLKKSSYEQKAALNDLIKQWVLDGDIGESFIQVLWDKYSRKYPNSTLDDSQAAIILLTMCATGKTEIIQKNLEKLAKYGLSRDVFKNYFLIKYTCHSLNTLRGLKNEDNILIKYPMNHEIIECLACVIVEHFTNFDNKLYSEIAISAITAIYHLSENADIVCEKILLSLFKKTDKSSIFENEEKLANEELCVRLILIVGHVAFSHWQYLENDVYIELKRRNAQNQSDGKNSNNSSEKYRCQSKNKSNSSIMNKKKNLNSPTMTEDFEDDALALADERITESIRTVCEQELFSENNIISIFSKIISKVCQSPNKFTSERIQSAASISLSKLLMISSEFCSENIQLFITVLEKTNVPDVKTNLILAFGDLTFRFPNAVEPWTIYFYNRLRDENRNVRYSALMVVSHLITNEMIKVRGQMSDVALCLVDDDIIIRSYAHKLFYELSAKGNSLYNIMPDIISRLSHPEYRTTEENFKTILKTLMKLITKDRHLESIVEKLCHRVGGAADERQCVDLSYCLTLMSYTERSLQKLIDNLMSYAEKLNYPQVLKNFTNIIIACKKQTKVGKLADLVLELESKIDVILTKGIENLESTFLKPTKTPMRSGKTPAANKSITESARNSSGRFTSHRKPKRLVMDFSDEE